MAASTSEADAAAVPWLDLPEGLTEKIIERLPIHDYVRFGAVCRRWRSIQRDHRLRHSPSSPPALNIPWFIPYCPRRESAVCSIGLLSSEEQRLHIPFSPTYLAFLESDRFLAFHEREDATVGTEDPSDYSSLPYGWLLFDDWPLSDRSYEFSLLNPITGEQTSLPYLGDLYDHYKAAISPPPRCDVFVLTFDKWGNRLHLYKRENPDWTYLWYNRGGDDWGVPMALTSVIYYEGKFYCFRLGKNFMVFDIDSPECCQLGSFNDEDHIKFQCLEMDQSLLPKDGPWPDYFFDGLEIFLVESNERMLLACKFFDSGPPRRIRTLVRVELFEADLSNRRWVKAEGLGDHVLIIYQRFAVSLVAADVGVNRNCIYILDAHKTEEQPPAQWNMFDLSTCEVADASLPFPPSPLTHLMFVPSIY